MLPVVIVLVGLLPFGPLPPRLLQPHRASLPVVLRAESRSGLLHSESIRAYAPSLVPKLEGLQDQDLDTIDELQRELQPSVEYLLQSAPAVASTLRLGLEVAYIAHLGQRRRSGEAYIIHPVNVACILGQSQMDLVSVVSACCTTLSRTRRSRWRSSTRSSGWRRGGSSRRDQGLQATKMVRSSRGARRRRCAT